MAEVPFLRALSLLLVASLVARLRFARFQLKGSIQCLIQRPIAAHQEVLFHFPAPYSIDERVGGLRLNEADRKPNKFPV
jgi:hypothetical protein